MLPPAFQFRGVTQRFRDGARQVVACRDINLDIEAGSFVAIVGPSGCGKSTLLNMVAGLLTPSAGEVLSDGQPVARPNTSIGYLTQRDTLLPWRTIEDNVAISLELAGMRKTERIERARRLLATVGLTGFEQSYPSQLSGGMRRRAILARTLIYEPKAMAMDEPFGALDAQLRMVMHQVLLEIWERQRTTILFVTHDIGEAVTLADRVVVFSARPGTVKAVIDIDLPRPRDVYRLRFLPRFVELQEQVWLQLEAGMRPAEAEA